MTRKRPTDVPPEGLLLRYISGEATLAEADWVRRWAAADPDREASLAELQAAWEQTAPVAEWDGRPLWDRISDELGTATTQSRQTWRAYALAAALAIAVGAGVLVARSRIQTDSTAAVLTTRDVATQRGQRAAFRLADGTRIVAGAETRLRIVTGPATRDVHLDGEAFFDVVHDTTRPFRVHTGAGVAEDIGTAFVVTAYPETHGMQVAVTHGEVALRPRPTEAPLLTLVEGDLGRLDTNGTATLTRAADLSAYRARAEGRLVFDGTRLGEAIPMLSRWYDVEIRLGESGIAERRLVAAFGDEPVSQVMQRIAMAIGVRATESRVDGRRVVQFSR